MPKHVLLSRAATLALALAILSFPAFGQRITRSRSSETASSAAQNFFPLAAGNSWTYVVEGQGPATDVTVDVGEPVDIGGVSYFPIRGFFGAEALVRMDGRGRVLEYLPDQRREALWYEMATPQGGGWTPELPGGCTGKATVKERNAAAVVPAGGFPEVIHIQYGPSDCADAGLAEERFGAGVGLLSRTETTIAGPRTMRLSRARVGGRTVEGAGLSFSVRIDKPVYTPNLMLPVDPGTAIPVLKATITMENTSEVPLKITFPSTQLFDLTIRPARGGDTVYTWSADKLFAAVVTEVTFGRRILEADIPLAANGRALPAGMYVLEAWLVHPEGKIFSGSVGFEVTEPVY